MKNEQEENEKNEPGEIFAEGVFDENLKDKIKLRGHNWKQRGYEIVCESCALHHGVFIGPDKWLVGIDEKGMPVFEMRR